MPKQNISQEIVARAQALDVVSVYILLSEAKRLIAAKETSPAA